MLINGNKEQRGQSEAGSSLRAFAFCALARPAGLRVRVTTGEVFASAPGDTHCLPSPSIHPSALLDKIRERARRRDEQAGNKVGEAEDASRGQDGAAVIGLHCLTS